VSCGLITGANGFVGTRLCQVLEDCGYQLRAALRQQNSDNDLAVQQKVIVGDMASIDIRWGDALKDVDFVVHLAARVHVMDENILDPLLAFRLVNLDGTINLAKQAAVAGVKRFIYISSIKVNGESTQPGAPFRVDDSPRPVEAYATSKFEAEQALLEVSAVTGMEVVIIRPPLVYGPGVKANFLNMMRWLSRGFPLPFGAITNKRTLVALDNLVDLINICIKHPAAANQTFFAGDGEDLSTTELLSRMGQALGRPALLVPVPVRLLEVLAGLLRKRALTQRICNSLQVDISKTRDILGWKPILAVDRALKITAEAYIGKE